MLHTWSTSKTEDSAAEASVGRLERLILATVAAGAGRATSGRWTRQDV